jgi:acyl-CoA hydrolase
VKTENLEIKPKLTKRSTFVAVDDTGRPVEVPQVIPETELEIQRYEAALRRKQLSLVLAGKLNPQDATELKAYFCKIVF